MLGFQMANKCVKNSHSLNVDPRASERWLKVAEKTCEA